MDTFSQSSEHATKPPSSSGEMVNSTFPIAVSEIWTIQPESECFCHKGAHQQGHGDAGA